MHRLVLEINLRENSLSSIEVFYHRKDTNMQSIIIDSKELASIGEAARVLGISIKTIYSMIYAHRLRFVEILGHRAVNVEDVRTSLKRIKVG